MNYEQSNAIFIFYADIKYNSGCKFNYRIYFCQITIMLQQTLLKHFFEGTICQHKIRVQSIIQWPIQKFFFGRG